MVHQGKKAAEKGLSFAILEMDVDTELDYNVRRN